MNRLLFVPLIVGAFLLGAARASAGPPLQTINLMPAFFSVWAAPKSTLDESVRIFKAKIFYPHEDLYGENFALDDPHIAWYLKRVSSKIPKFRKVAVSVEGALPRYEMAFESAFPKFEPASVTVYLMPSMNSFDGQTTDVNGRHALLMGIDALSEEPFLPLGILAAHELFHIYHHEINPAFFVTPSENDLNRYGLYRQVWAEGLATFVSEKLNSGATDAQALASDALAKLPDSDTRKMACMVQDNFDATHTGYVSLLFDGGNHPKGLPPRGGYYIGFLVAQKLSRLYSLAELADLAGDDLHSKVLSAVQALCAGG